MKGLLKSIFIGVLLIGLNNQVAYSATDIVKTYHSDWVESIYFKNGAAVLVTANDGITTGGSKNVEIVPTPGSTFTLTLYDNGVSPDANPNDGTYTGQIAKVSTEPMSQGNLQLGNGQGAKIVVDLDNNGDSGTVTIYADYTKPTIPTLAVSEEYFSPKASFGKKDTTLITFKSNEKGRYEILVDNKVPSGTPKGTLSGNTEVSYEWDGRDKYGNWFLEGIHTIYVKVWDEAENESDIKSCNVWIDNTFPSKVYMSLTDDVFSPGTSPTSQDITDIMLYNDESDPISYELSINGRILLGTKTPQPGTGTGYISQNSSAIVEWGGRDVTGTLFNEGFYIINLNVEDRAGNTALVTAEVTIDNTPPMIDYLIDDSGGNPCYRDQEIFFVLQTLDWIGSTLVKADEGIGVCTFNGKILNLIDCRNGIYVQYYKVTQTDVGTFAYTAYFQDKAGNIAINNGVTFGTITLRGNEFPPAVGARIVRLKAVTPEKGTFTIISNNVTLATSTMTIKSNNIKGGDKVKIKTTADFHVWVASATKDGEVTVSNTDIFFGFPIDNYKNIATSTITEGAWFKPAMKIGDDVTINLTAVNILERLGVSSTRTSTTVIFKDSRIATGTMVVAYDDNNDHIWLGTASKGGEFEFSNANIYFGNLVGDYKGLGEINGIIACFAIGGVARADMGIIVPGISLYDDGLYTHKDIKAGDGVYSNYYTIKEKDDTTSYFYGYFRSAGNDAKNNGIRSQEEVVIDATPPNITNFGAFPGIFQPGDENVTIKYTLEEKSEVTIEIWDEYGRLIRRLTPPEPAYGDNCNATWDGKNMGGGLVKDGIYYFKINATDKAGNEAEERIGVIKATTIEIKITELKISKSSFTPTPETPDEPNFRTDIHVTVKANKEQLKNLGFLMDSNDIYTLPYLLVDFTCFDNEGNELRPVSLPDLDGESDSDPFTNGYPNYYTGPGTETLYGLYPKLGGDLPDEGDGNKGNDWDTLVPLKRFTQDEYYIDWGVGIKDWNVPDGTYLIRVQVELVGSYWKFVDYVRDINKIPIAEMWHQKPNHAYGDSRSSEPVVGRIEVTKSPITKPDYIAPVVIATDPGANTIHEPTENISRISAQLMDQGGSGLNLTGQPNGSYIILKNSIGMVVAGAFSNNGLDTVWWELKEPLTTPDDYTIEVRPVDKANNGLAVAPQLFTFTILDRVGPKVSDILVDSTVLKNGDIFGPNVIKKISVTLSEIETGKSKVDFATSRIIIKNEVTGRKDEPHNLFTGTRRNEITTENNGRIIYENLTIDEGGTYTIWVEAWDKAPSPNLSSITKISFYINLEGYINVDFNYPGFGTKTYLKIPPETKAFTNTTTGITVSTNTITIRQGTITKENENYRPIDPVIEFWWFNSEHIDIKLDKVISLTMYYGHIQLPAGVTKDDLAIWKYNGISWNKIIGDNNKNDDKITINLPVKPEVTLEDHQYAIMYLVPMAVNVQYYHYQKGLVTCLKIPESTMVNNQVVGTSTIIAGTLTLTRTGYVVIEPVIQFFLLGNPVTNKITFNNDVTLIMYYTSNDVDNLRQRGLKETDLAIYGYDGTNWIKITNSYLDQNKKEISYNTKIIYEKYAIMYLIPEITERPEVFEQSVYAYPNPAKGGKVTFRYDLIRDAKVSVKIYTIMGDEVWSKEYSAASPQGKQGSHGVYPPGNDAIIWNCENNAGKKVATELYIYTLTASDESGEVTVTKKLIVIQ